MMNYDELYRELERDAREAGLEKEHLEWQLGLEGWAKDPVAVAMRDWRLQHAPETLEGKSEEQVGREMAMVHLLAESRRTAAAQAWMRSPQSSQAKDAQQKAALMNAAAGVRGLTTAVRSAYSAASRSSSTVTERKPSFSPRLTARIW